MSNSLSSLKEVAQEKLERYTSPKLSYAFQTYDVLGDPDLPLTAADMLMANLLSLKLSGSEVTELFVDGDEPPQQLRRALDKVLTDLREVEPFETFESLPSLERALESLAAANYLAYKSVPQWTAVTVSKVLHRRLPHIVPLIDSRVASFYGCNVRNPEKIRRALWEDIRENCDWLRELAATKTTPDGRSLSLLRLADILIWTPLPD